MGAAATRRPIREDLFIGPLDDLEKLSLCGSRCEACGETTLGANAVCPNCGGEDVAAIALARRGELWTHTVVRHRPPGNYQGPEPFQPFGLGLVELPEGLRVLSPIKAAPEALSIGMPVEFHAYVLRTDDAGVEVVGFDFRPA